MILYTDGITESKNENGKYFEVEGIISTIINMKDKNPDMIKENIISNALNVTSFQLDDMSVVIIKREI